MVCAASLLYPLRMRSATLPPIRVEAEVKAVVAAAAWHRVQAEFVTRGEAAIERWKQQGGGHMIDEVMAGLQTRLDDAKRRAAQRAGQ